MEPLQESIVLKFLLTLNVPRLLDDGIGYINLGGFNSGAAKDFRTAFLLLRYSAPQDLKGLILDLRGNPGGLLDMAVEIGTQE